jgi:hypothetical protein
VYFTLKRTQIAKRQEKSALSPCLLPRSSIATSLALPPMVRPRASAPPCSPAHHTQTADSRPPPPPVLPSCSTHTRLQFPRLPIPPSPNQLPSVPSARTPAGSTYLRLRCPAPTEASAAARRSDLLHDSARRRQLCVRAALGSGDVGRRQGSRQRGALLPDHGLC